jgi:hypothetical protein
VQIEDCNRLQAIEMNVSSMTHLALGSCPSLEILMLRAPALTQLDLQCATAQNVQASSLAVPVLLDVLWSAPACTH